MTQLVSLLLAAAIKAASLAECVAEVIPTAHAAEVLVAARKLVAAVEILREAQR